MGAAMGSGAALGLGAGMGSGGAAPASEKGKGWQCEVCHAVKAKTTEAIVHLNGCTKRAARKRLRPGASREAEGGSKEAEGAHA